MTEILEFNIHSSVEEGAVDITIKTAQQVDMREKLFYEMAKEKSPIIAMKVSNMTLEDVFLELTGADKEVRQNQLELENQTFEREEKEEVKEDDSNI